MKNIKAVDMIRPSNSNISEFFFKFLGATMIKYTAYIKTST
jgi:hypothetical protein